VNVVFVLLGDYPMSEFYVPTFRNRQVVPKCWHIKCRRQGITQKKEYKNFSKVFCTRISSYVHSYYERYYDLSRKNVKKNSLLRIVAGNVRHYQTPVSDTVRHYKWRMKNILSFKTMNREGKSLVIFLSWPLGTGN